MTYPSVYDLVCRIRERTGIAFGPHTFRHTYATELLRRKVPVEVVQHLLGHASIATTTDAYALSRGRRHPEVAQWNQQAVTGKPAKPTKSPRKPRKTKADPVEGSSDKNNV
jgi:integrase